MKPSSADDSGAALREAVERYRASKPDTAEPPKPAKGPRQQWGPISEIPGYPLNIDIHSSPPEPPPVRLETAPGGPQLRKAVHDTPSTTTEPMEPHPITDMEAHPLADAAPAAEDITVKRMTSWRDLIKVHPAADLLPIMSEEELRTLGEDIKAYGMAVQITLAQYDGTWFLLDGRNRLDALELVGVKFALSKHGMLMIDGESGAENGEDMLDLWLLYDDDEANPYARVKSLNIERRQLTTEQKREIAAKLLKAQPERSNRAIAEQVKLSDKTVGTVRTQLEATAEIPQSEIRVSTTGQKRKAAKKPTTTQATEEPKPAVEEPQAPEPAKVTPAATELAPAPEPQSEAPKPANEPSGSSPPGDVLLDTFHQRTPADQVAVMQLFWDVLSPSQRQQLAPKHEASEAHEAEVPTMEHFEAFWERASRELRNEISKFVQTKVAEARKRQVDEMVKGAMHPAAP